MSSHASEIRFTHAGVSLEGEWERPEAARGVIVFAHGAGSGRKSPRNQWVARELRDAGFATLLFDLLTEEEDRDARARFDIARLTDRLIGATHWAMGAEGATGLPIGYYGSSTGAAAALRAAAALNSRVSAVVSRGGRPDLARDALPSVHAPTLLIVGGEDAVVWKLNRQAALRLTCPYRIAVIEGATHLFVEPGALASVSRLAIEWFERHVGSATHPHSAEVLARRRVP